MASVKHTHTHINGHHCGALESVLFKTPTTKQIDAWPLAPVYLPMTGVWITAGPLQLSRTHHERELRQNFNDPVFKHCKHAANEQTKKNVCENEKLNAQQGYCC